MTDLEKFTQLPPDFDGQVRLFPLPDLVVFPNSMQPLHIFEPRYCELLADSLASDRLIAMATLRPSWHAPLADAPPLAPHVCICRIVSHSPAEDDRHNVLLVGLRRGQIIAEVQCSRPYRIARVEPLEDLYPVIAGAARLKLKRKLLDAFRRLIPDVAEVQKNLHDLMASQMPLGPITDIISFTLQFPSEIKLQLLGQTNVDLRAQALIEALQDRHQATASTEAAPVKPAPFPPPFSLN